MADSSSSSNSSLGFYKLLALQLCVTWLLFGVAYSQLSPNFYSTTCPNALSIIQSTVAAAIANETRMGASLTRLFFHDCFVQGCDGSCLLDDTPTFIGEKTAFPNNNSLRGFDVIDKIKSNVEAACPGVVSCADIVAVAARDSVVILGGPSWTVQLGRRDSTTANFTAANTDLPSPFLNLSGLMAAFRKKNFTAEEMVTASGAHTFGDARCTNFRARIYNETNINPEFASSKKSICPITGGDNNLSTLDVTTPYYFDNAYYKNLLNEKGLLHSDQQLYNGGSTDSQVESYSSNPVNFSADFSNVMVKMGNLSPLTGSNGQIRYNCRKVN